MKEEYPTQIELEGENSDVVFEFLEEREGVRGTTLIYDAEADDNLLYHENVNDWRKIEDEKVFSGLIDNDSELLDGGVVEYSLEEERARLLLTEERESDDFYLSDYDISNEGIITDTSPAKN